MLEKLIELKRLFDKYEIIKRDRILMRKTICEIKEYADVQSKL